MQDFNINTVTVDYVGNGKYAVEVDGPDVSDVGVAFESMFANEAVEFAYKLAEKNVVGKGQHVELGVEISPCVQVIMTLEPSPAKIKAMQNIITEQNISINSERPWAGQGNTDSPFLG